LRKAGARALLAYYSANPTTEPHSSFVFAIGKLPHQAFALPQCGDSAAFEQIPVWFNQFILPDRNIFVIRTYPYELVPDWYTFEYKLSAGTQISTSSLMSSTPPDATSNRTTWAAACWQIVVANKIYCKSRHEHH
jgi:hypothetical protein